MPYLGKVIPIKEAHGPHADHSYIANAGFYEIDASATGSVARFINHSCSPNVAMQLALYKYYAVPIVKLLEGCRLKPGDWLGIDYGWYANTEEEKKVPCFCGSAKCEGYLMYDPPSMLHPSMEDLEYPQHLRREKPVELTKSHLLESYVDEGNSRPSTYYSQVKLAGSNIVVCAEGTRMVVTCFCLT